MREIKFRAWSNFDKKMVFLNSAISIVNVFTSIEYDVKDNVNPNFQLMQYTGLKDKNDVEIYEGDIVATKNSKYEIIFNKCCFWGIDRMGKYPIYQIYHYIMDDEKFEVIGNIYENPELLEASK